MDNAKDCYPYLPSCYLNAYFRYWNSCSSAVAEGLSTGARMFTSSSTTDFPSSLPHTLSTLLNSSTNCLTTCESWYSLAIGCSNSYQCLLLLFNPKSSLAADFLLELSLNSSRSSIIGVNLSCERPIACQVLDG